MTLRKKKKFLVPNICIVLKFHYQICLEFVLSQCSNIHIVFVARNMTGELLDLPDVCNLQLLHTMVISDLHSAHYATS